jgi:hypothetical protein
MFAGKTWISNKYKKVKNPTKIPGVINRYEGPLDENYDFKFQKDNFEKITKSLEPFQTFPQEIYYSERNGKSTFVVTWNNPDIFWHKYEGNALGSGQNYIYWKGHKINTTVWIKMNLNDITTVLDGTDDDISNTVNDVILKYHK